ncbi:MAG: hypothetical protein IE909_06545 [Campylobacterales bacterium]|nr:hypothetical protein [Campylobacterales bacterium]
MQFDALYAMVKSNLASEIEAVKENKQKLQKKGGMLYKKMCRPIDEKFTSAAQAKTYIEKHQSCENINTKQLHMVSLY